jgi:hypothetical protein
MDLSTHRASPIAWVCTAAAFAAAAFVVILHWAPIVDGQRRTLEVAGVVLLAVSGLAAGVLETRRQRKLDALDR